MEAWYKLAMAVVATEFPDWEVLRAFGVFALHEERKGSGATIAADSASCALQVSFLQRLANIFGVDRNILQAQWWPHFACVDQDPAWRGAARRGGAVGRGTARHAVSFVITIACWFHSSVLLHLCVLWCTSWMVVGFSQSF